MGDDFLNNLIGLQPIANIKMKNQRFKTVATACRVVRQRNLRMVGDSDTCAMAAKFMGNCSPYGSRTASNEAHFTG